MEKLCGMKMMRDNKWFWIIAGCLIFWAVIFSWAEWALTSRAETDRTCVSAEELEAYYDSLELLAVCVEAEAGNQGMEGKRMVADVILNRVDHPDWPDTITEVITQPYEFSSYWDGSMDKVWEPSEETFRAVQMELEARSWPELYYFTADGWSRYGTPWKKAGDHYFSTR